MLSHVLAMYCHVSKGHDSRATYFRDFRGYMRFL